MSKIISSAVLVLTWLIGVLSFGDICSVDITIFTDFLITAVSTLIVIIGGIMMITRRIKNHE